MSDMPDSWAETTVGTLSKVNYGKGLRKDLRNEAGPYPVYGSAGLAGHHDEPLVDSPVVVVGRKGNAGEVHLSSAPCWPIDTTYFLKPPTGVDERFFAHQLRGLGLGELDSSTAIPSLRRGDLECARFVLPPFAEQRRIVAAIEEHFARLDSAEVEVRRAQRRLGSFWGAALDCALRDEWPRTALDELNDDDRPICYGILKPKTDGVPAVRYIEVRSISDGRIDVDGLHRTTIEMHQQFIRSELKENDVVLAIRGSFDRAAVVPRELAGANVSRDVARIAPSAALLPAFLALFLESREAMTFFRARARGVAVQGINIGDLRQLPVPAPPLEEQRKTVEFMARVSQQRDTIRAELVHAAKRASRLRRAVLAAAFSGRLVRQDPSDEPASALLDRIESERVAATPSRRKKAAS